MIGARIHIVAYNTDTVTDRLGEATRQILMKTGANIVHHVLPTLKYRRGSSKPGTPPHLHFSKRGPSPLTKLAFAMPDPMRVIAGVVRESNKPPGVARTLEEGGVSVNRSGRMVSIKPRPFMKPIFDVESMKVPAMFANSITN